MHPITCMKTYTANIHLAKLILSLHFLSYIVKNQGNTLRYNNSVI